MSKKPDNPPGKDKGEKQINYVIDETITIPKEKSFEFWDLDIDSSENETYVLRAIARSDNTKIRVYILPKEELDFFKEDENVWWEYRSGIEERLKDSTTITHRDEEPYYHEGDYVLVVEAQAQRSAQNEFKISVKFRRE